MASTDIDAFRPDRLLISRRKSTGHQWHEAMELANSFLYHSLSLPILLLVYLIRFFFFNDRYTEYKSDSSTLRMISVYYRGRCIFFFISRVRIVKWATPLNYCRDNLFISWNLVDQRDKSFCAATDDLKKQGFRNKFAWKY